MNNCKDVGKIFKKYPDHEFQQVFLNIISQSRRENTYKFALARFLLEYAESETKTEINFKKIAEYFLKYYWPQICRSKLFQSYNDSQSVNNKRRPLIVKILKNEFSEPYYPQTFEQIREKELQKVEKSIKEIEKKCFKIVIFAFQRIEQGNEELDLKGMFFDYCITGKKPSRPDQVYVDFDYGIKLNPYAIDFLKRYNGLLKKSVIFEWAKFLEPRNIGYPQIIKSIESEFEPRGLQKERKLLEKIQDRCFYCEKILEKDEINVEHIIPYSYLKHNKMWNLSLACQKCNCKKLGSLPKPKSDWMKKIHDRNEKFRKKMPLLDKHLQELGSDYRNKMEIMYDLSTNQGFIEKTMP
ncbi:MAG: HNH endonuclease [Candidatus Nitrosopelagicus sp.]|nr:HNH endonuclease [Candidatus Nitrosopelagicus sp.]